MYNLEALPVIIHAGKKLKDLKVERQNLLVSLSIMTSL